MTTAGSLAGKVALITGASSGIGAATAKALAAAGAAVAVAARRGDRLKTLVDDITAKGGQARAIETDLGKHAAIEHMVRQATDWRGHLDILVNNAGVSPLALLENSKVEDLQHMIDINLAAVIYTTRLAMPALCRVHGDIVNIGSVAVRVHNPGSAMYAATKSAVAAFSESLRKELIKDKVRVSLINPGLVRTDIVDGFADAGMRERTIKRVTTELDPLQPEDIADIVIFVVTRPPRVAVNDMLVRPTGQE